MRSIIRAFTRAVLLLICLAALAFGLLVCQIDRLGRRDGAKPVDVIVVLGARVAADGQPGPDLASRTTHAIELWKGGFAPDVICTGGFKDEPLSSAAVCARYAAQHGISADRIWIADGSTNTIEDAAVAAALMAAKGWRTAILVSHPLHLYRSRWLFRRLGVEAFTSPTSTETGRIAAPLRIWYATREAAAITATALDAWALIPREWIARLQQWVYRVQ